MENILLTMDEDTIISYEKVYFKKHPQARKKPIEHPYHPSINVWAIMRRNMANALKQKWKEYIIWFVTTNGYKDLKIDTCDMEFTSYFKTRIRKDLDNQTPKFIMDGFTEAGLIIDDDSKHIESLTLRCGYDKDRPRTEILIKNIKLSKDVK